MTTRSWLPPFKCIPQDCLRWGLDVCQILIEHCSATCDPEFCKIYIKATRPPPQITTGEATSTSSPITSSLATTATTIHSASPEVTTSEAFVSSANTITTQESAIDGSTSTATDVGSKAIWTSEIVTEATSTSEIGITTTSTNFEGESNTALIVGASLGALAVLAAAALLVPLTHKHGKAIVGGNPAMVDDLGIGVEHEFWAEIPADAQAANVI